MRWRYRFVAPEFLGGLVMAELIGLMIVLGFIHQTAKRRGGRGWLWVVIGLAGYLLMAPFLIMFGSQVLHLTMLFAWGWIGLTLVGAYVLTGGLKSAGMTWQCPGCGMLNDPSTLVCGCGVSYDQES